MKFLSILLTVGVLLFASSSMLSAGPMEEPWVKPDTRAQHIFDLMVEKMSGEWKLSDKEHQGPDLCGVVQYLGKDLAMTTYSTVGRGTILLEMMLTGTDREMVTTYHCNRRETCETLLATHYCAKRNSPRFILNLDETTDTKFVFDCDMGTSLCQSFEDHIFKITHEFSEDGRFLKSSYLGRTNHILNDRHSIFVYERR